jgi:N6-adenosine-specific RNA methylase IME4
MDGSLTFAEATWTEGMSLGPISLSFSTPEEWRETGLRWGRTMRSVAWLHGDWWNAGAKFGPIRKQIVTSPEWLAAGGSAYDSCKHFGSLARRFPNDMWRRLHPSPSFYQAVRRLPDAVAHPLLQKAANANWTLRRIRREVGRIRNHYEPAGPDIAGSLEALICEGKRFRALLVDPPWRIRIGDGEGDSQRGHGPQYDDMSFDKLSALPVSSVLTDDGFVFLWCTAACLEDGLALLKAWNCHYRTCAIWVKDALGTGYYFRMRHELLLLGVRPKSRPFVEKPISLITAERRKHSEKPSVHYLIAAACDEGPFLEMFARRRLSNPDWTFCGDELPEEVSSSPGCD